MKPLDIPIIALAILWAIQLNALSYIYGWYVLIPVVIITFAILFGILVLAIKDLKL